MKRRARMMRRRIVVGAIVAFTLLWGVVFGQMISGHDPVLANAAGAGSKSAGGASATPQVALVGRTEEDEGGEDETSPLESELQAEEEQAQAELAELEQAELEQAEAEQAELEQIEAEERELEAVTTGQS